MKLRRRLWRLINSLNRDLDSQTAIPLAEMTKERVTNWYDLMDSAYDAEEMRKKSLELNHVPLGFFQKYFKSFARGSPFKIKRLLMNL